MRIQSILQTISGTKIDPLSTNENFLKSKISIGFFGNFRDHLRTFLLHRKTELSCKKQPQSDVIHEVFLKAKNNMFNKLFYCWNTLMRVIAKHLNTTTFKKYLNTATFKKYLNTATFKKYFNMATFKKYLNTATFKKYLNMATFKKYLNMASFKKYLNMASFKKYLNMATFKKYLNMATFKKIFEYGNLQKNI